ncbi:bifunctional DNA primase/polymerase [Streptomyces sp. NA04227]|nr:bifunctional DNA primase/polymerase [Streptomyces sp. NA04227]
MSSPWHPATASPAPESRHPLPALPGPAPLGTGRDRHPLFGGGLGHLGGYGDPGGLGDFDDPFGAGPAFPDAPGGGLDAYGATAEGARWLAAASTHPHSTLALWRERPASPVVLSCGQHFDVVNAPAVFGRRMLDRLLEEGAGSGPVAAHRGRVLLFAAPGTAARLPSLLHWEEWGSAGSRAEVPVLLCHGRGDAVTVPPPSAAHAPDVPAGAGARPDSRWLVAPDSGSPWLPGPDILLWAAVRAARAGAPHRPSRTGGTSGHEGRQVLPGQWHDPSGAAHTTGVPGGGARKTTGLV